LPDRSILDEAVGLSAESLSPGRLAYRRFLTHRGAVVSVFVLFVLVLWVLLAPVTARYGVNEQVFDISQGANQNLPPSRIAWFGTDIIGRDVYSRVLYGVRVSLVIGIASAVFSLALGAVIGAIAGLKGGLFDDIVMRVTDIFLAFPFLVALLVIRNMFGKIGWITWLVGTQGSLRFMVFLFAIFGWMSVARVLRAQVLSLKEREFVEAARALGASNSRIIVKHLLPNSIGPMLVSLSLGVVGAIVSEATLSLFGYGPDPGTGATSLGLLVSGSKSAVRAGYWWLALYPFAALLIITLCVSFIGDGLRDAFDPKHGGGRA
jgi:peptide/nickel transport system permease protein